MHFTNIHVAPAADSQLSTTGPQLPRLRTLTNDPAREYAQRPGEVERLPDSVAALILCKKGFSQVTRNGISVEGITRKPLKFWHEDSVTIQEKAGSNEKVLWVLNRLQPDVIHILTSAGAYVETIPLDEKAEWFEPTMKVLAAKRRSQQRSIDRLRELHAPDTEEAIAAATANDTAMKSAVHIFPHDDHKAQPQGRARSIDPETVREPSSTGQRSNLGTHKPETVELPSRAGGRSRSPARGAFAKADRIHEIQQHLHTARTAHAERTQTVARRVSEVTDRDLEDLTSDGPEPIEAATLTATEISSEVDASEWIL